MSPYPEWLRILSWAYLTVSFICAAIIIGDELRRPQKTMLMNFVWPITFVYFGPPSLWGYFNLGLKMTNENWMRHPLSGQGCELGAGDACHHALRGRLCIGRHCLRVVSFRNGIDIRRRRIPDAHCSEVI